MPKIDKIFTLDITPERFLEACSYEELVEVSLLLDGCLRRAPHAENMSNHLGMFGGITVEDAKSIGEAMRKAQE